MPKVVSYYRTSTDRQKKEKTWESQKIDVESYADKNGFEITKEFVEFESAFKGRPIFEEVLDYVAEHPNIDGIVVWNFDRLLRDPETYMKVCVVLAPLGMKVFQVTGRPFDPNQDEDFMLGGILAFVKRYEARLISKRQKAGIRRKIEETGIWGRPRKKISKAVVKSFIQKDKEGKEHLILSKSALAKVIGVARPTLLQWFKDNGYKDLIEKQPDRLKKVQK